MSNAQHLLKVNQLRVQFTSADTPVQAVKNLSFSMQQGEFLAIVGESGSGKSVTAQSIMRLLPESAQISGTLMFDGQDITTLAPAQIQALRGKRIAMIFQEPMSALNPLHSIGKQIEEMFRIHQSQLSKADRHAKLAELLVSVGLEKFIDRLDAYPHQLSGGERQRVMIAMAMANNPDLLIADEPTTALDVTLQAQILALLKRLQKERNLSIMLITHDLSIVQHLADRVLVMKHGELIETGETQSLFAAPTKPYTKALLAAVPYTKAPPMPANAQPLLHSNALYVSYAKKQGLFARKPKTSAQQNAVRAASIHLATGETLGLVGESGSGKTSLALALLRLIPSSGDIVYLDQSLNHASKRDMRRLRNQLQIVFQDPYASLNPRMNIAQIITEGLRVHQPHLTAKARQKMAKETIESVGLTAEMLQRYPHEFSGGQRQRISIARAIILQPKLIVLDEPTSALDVSVQSHILALLKRFQKERGISYIFISHDLRVVRSISHRVAVMKSGEIIEMGDTENLFNNPQKDYTRRLMQASLNLA